MPIDQAPLWLGCAMRFSWAQHQNVARKLGTADQQQLGVALALMGAALLMLAEDLAALESRNTIW